MTRSTKTLLGTITDRAEQNFDSAVLAETCKSPIDPVKWKAWETCWWEEAKKFMQELRDEGLKETASSRDKSLKSLDYKKEYYNDTQTT